MGYNQEDKEIVLRNFSEVKSVIDMGAANDYTTPNTDKPPFISEWYKSLGIDDYACVDLAGDNGAQKLDVAFPVEIERQYDLLVNTGFSEHVVQMDGYVTVAFHDGHINSIYPKEVLSVEMGFYCCWVNMFGWVKEGGKMIHVNPRSLNWIGHGYTYLTVAFYERLQEVADIRIIELYEHAACGNTTDGWNVVAVLSKIGTKFPTFEEFSLLPIYNA